MKITISQTSNDWARIVVDGGSVTISNQIQTRNVIVRANRFSAELYVEAVSVVCNDNHHNTIECGTKSYSAVIKLKNGWHIAYA